MNALCRFIAVGLAGTMLWAACGGDDSSNSAAEMTQLCKDTCKKMGECLGFQVDCNAMCTQGDGGSGSGSNTCKDVDAQIAHLKSCLQKDCKDLNACFESAPCNNTTGGAGGSGGSGGSGGAGGSTGGSGGTTGGSGGGDAGANCGTLLACCNAIADANVKQACMMTHTNAMGNDMFCGIAYEGLRGAGICK